MDIYDTILLIFFAAMVIGVIVWYILVILPYKHRVIIKELAENRKIVTIDKAKEYIDKDGVAFWRLRKEKDVIKKNMPVPPSSAIEVTDKGKKFVECYRTESGEYIFLKDSGKVKPIPIGLFDDVPSDILAIENDDKRENVYNAWKSEILANWKSENKVTEAFQPLTTPQRLVLIKQIQKAHERKGKSWKEQLPMIVGVSALVVLCISLMIFYGEIAAPVLEANKQTIQLQTIQTEQLNLIKDIKQGVQTITGDINDLEKRVNKVEKVTPD